MNFAFSEDQDLIRKSAADFVKGQSSLERVREMFEAPDGFSREIYGKMAEQGWLGTIIPEEYGGAGLGCVDLTCIQEELGKGLLPEPLVPSAILGGGTIFFGCNDAQKKSMLPAVAAGETVLAVGAYELTGRFDLAHVETTAKESGGEFTINGQKSFVEAAAQADKILVSARTNGKKDDPKGITLFAIDSKALGLTLTPVKVMDHRRRYTVDLKNVKAKADQIIGSRDNGHNALEQAADRATVALCAEMAGGMEAALSMSVAYAKERVQFGKPIGSFQAIKHKCADMYVALETARSALYYAAMALDESMPDARAAVSAAKALCSDNYVHIAKEAIQIHGGIGFTDEHNAHLYYKRAIVSSVTYGDATYHRDRYATAKGF